MKFLCSYAYDVPQFFDFIVDAKNEADAENKIQAALKAGKFAKCRTTEYENEENHRVFVQHPLSNGHEHFYSRLTKKGFTP